MAGTERGPARWLTKTVAFCLLPFSSSVLLTLSFEPFSAGCLAWVGLAPLLFGLRRRGVLSAGGLALLFGLLFSAGTFFWCRTVASLPNFAVFLFFLSLYSFLFGVLYRLASGVIGSWIVLGGPAIWVALECLRSNFFFLAWPMNLLAHSQYQYLPLIQIVDVTGVYGLSFLMVMVNQLISELPDQFPMGRVSTSDRRVIHRAKGWGFQCLLAGTALALVSFYGLQRMAGPKGDRHIRVALVQANVVARNNMPLAEQAEHLRAYRELTGDAAKEKPDLIVWPASSLPAPINTSRLVRITLQRLSQETGAYMVVGGAGYEKVKPKKERDMPYANNEFLISPAGRVERQYNKIRLVPFNEYLPLEGSVRWPEWITTVKESFQAGTNYTLFQVGEAKFGTPICWENDFPQFFSRFVKDGANLMVSVANEGFLGDTAGPYQNLAMSVFRAVENRVAVVRSTTTGVSAFIGSEGKILERVQDASGKDLLVSGFLVRDVPLSDAKTFYTLHGDLFVYVVIGIASLTLLAALRARIRPRRGSI